VALAGLQRPQGLTAPRSSLHIRVKPGGWEADAGADGGGSRAHPRPGPTPRRGPDSFRVAGAMLLVVPG